MLQSVRIMRRKLFFWLETAMCPMVRWMVLAKVMLAMALSAGEAIAESAPIQQNRPVLCGEVLPLDIYSEAERNQIAQQLRLYQGGSPRGRPWCAHLGVNVPIPQRASGCTKARCSRKGDCNYCGWVDIFGGGWGTQVMPRGCLRYTCTEWESPPSWVGLPR